MAGRSFATEAGSSAIEVMCHQGHVEAKDAVNALMCALVDRRTRLNVFKFHSGTVVRSIRGTCGQPPDGNVQAAFSMEAPGREVRAPGLGGIAVEQSVNEMWRRRVRAATVDARNDEDASFAVPGR